MQKLNLLLSVLLLASVTLADEPLPEPEKEELSINALAAQAVNLDGRVVETEITSVPSFGQISAGQYRAVCCYYKGKEDVIIGERVLVPEEGKEFFETLAQGSFGSSNSKRITC